MKYLHGSVQISEWKSVVFHTLLFDIVVDGLNKQNAYG